MYGVNRLTSSNHLRALFTVATATATYSSRRCFAESPPSPATDEFVNVAEKSKIRGDDGETLPQNAYNRKELPPKLLSENVAMLTCESSAAGGIFNNYLIGKCHRSPESKREVEDLIQFLKPEVVFLELCPSRLTVEHKVEGRSTVQPAGTLHEKPHGTIIGEMTVIGDGAESSEFIGAYYLAMKYDAKVILGDRPIEITKKRMADKITFWDFIKLSYYTKFQKERFGAHSEMNINDPCFEEPLVHERDHYI